jgi:hypothetical protein
LSSPTCRGSFYNEGRQPERIERERRGESQRVMGRRERERGGEPKSGGKGVESKERSREREGGREMTERNWLKLSCMLLIATKVNFL